MSERPEDGDELILRYLAGEADSELERRVRERLMSDESARARLVTLACQQQALSDVLGEAAGRKPSSRILVQPPRVIPRSGPGYGWLFAAAAIVLAWTLALLLRPGEEPRTPRKEALASKAETRSPEKARPEEASPKAPLTGVETPKPLPPPAPAPEKREAPQAAPLPGGPQKDAVPSRSGEPQPSAPAPKAESPARTTSETVVATLDRVEGEFWILSDGRRSKGEPRQALTSGQGLETAGPAAGAELSYADGTRLKIGPETVVREFREPKGRIGKRLTLVRGVLAADVRKQPPDQPLVIATPQGEATVLGTRLRLSVEPDEKGSTRLDVEEGKVRLKRLLDGKTVDVASGHFAVAGSTSSEFKSLPSILSGLVGYWRFEDPVGATMTDSSGQGNDGILVGKARRTLGKFGQGLDLDGATAIVQVPHAASLDPGTSTFSVSIWLRSRKPDVWAWNVIFKDNGKFQSYYFLAVATKPRFEFSTGDAKVSIDGQTGVNDNKWHHVVAVRNSLYSAQLYVDGVLEASGAVPPSASSSVHTNSPLTIGGGNQSFFAGQIDDVRIYNRALSADEVRQLFSGR
jgi:hypothetical protein